jgi:hypothetical protein
MKERAFGVPPSHVRHHFLHLVALIVLAGPAMDACCAIRLAPNVLFASLSAWCQVLQSISPHMLCEISAPSVLACVFAGMVTPSGHGLSNGEPLLAVMAVVGDYESRNFRDRLRKAWYPGGSSKALEDCLGWLFCLLVGSRCPLDI